MILSRLKPLAVVMMILAMAATEGMAAQSLTIVNPNEGKEYSQHADMNVSGTYDYIYQIDTSVYHVFVQVYDKSEHLISEGQATISPDYFGGGSFTINGLHAPDLTGDGTVLAQSQDSSFNELLTKTVGIVVVYGAPH